MRCPNDGKEIAKKLQIGETSIVRCSHCSGLWFDAEELRRAKDERAPAAEWFDFDLWKNKADFELREGPKTCPADGKKLVSVRYQGSDIVIDACRACNGIWLDKGELAKIVEYAKREADGELLRNYLKNLIEEGKEIFTGPEDLRSEILDFLLVAKLFRYKFMAQHPVLAQILSAKIPPLTG